MNKLLNLVFVSFFLVALSIGNVNAFEIDNVLKEVELVKDIPIFIGDKQIDYNEIWETYEPIKIDNLFGLGETLWEGAITEHDDYCGVDCSSTIEISLANEGVLIDDVIFETLQEDGSWIKQDVRSYQFYVNDEPYELGEEVKAGTYTVRLDAEKKPSRTVDWIITTNGKTLDSWATWGGVFVGTEYQLSVIATGLDESGLEINDVIVTELQTGIYKINTSNADDEVSRALIMKTLFYGTTGSDPRATSQYINTTTIYSNDERDEGKRGNYIGATFSAGGSAVRIYLINFTDTSTNYDVSSWSRFSFAVQNGLNNIRWEIPVGTIRHTLIDEGTSDEIGTDTSSDNNDNPTNSQIRVVTWSGDAYAKIIILSNNKINGSTTAPGTFSKTDFFINESFPEFLYSEGQITLNSPIDDFSTNAPVTFNCSANVTGGSTIVNMSIYTNESGIWEAKNTTTGLSGTFETQTWTRTITDGNYIWTCQACDSDGDCGFAPQNYSLSVDANAPNITLTSPISVIESHSIGDSLNLNWTVSDVNLDSCWYDYNNTNTTVTCGDNTTTFNAVESEQSITFYANDIVGNENSEVISWAYKILINNETFNSLTYETQEETFEVNLTANSSLTNVQLFYDGTTYATTQSGTIYSSILQISTGVKNNTFKWLFTYAGESINTTENNQTVNLTEFVLCNATNNIPYINYTFLDEETGTNVSSTIDTSTFNYWLGDGTVSKTLIYSNSTPSNYQKFCFKPGTETMKSNRTIQYSATGYPQRRSYETITLTNITTQRTLYLLSSADGIYSTFQVLDSNGQSLSGVQALAERQFDGSWTTIGNDNTDDAGSVTFWLNPDFDHRFTFIKSGCTTEVFSVRPTQTNYVITMSCVGEQDITSIHAGSVEGIRYNHYPPSGVIQVGTYTFSYTIASDRDNIESALFRIINASSSAVLLERSSSCTPSGCTLSGNLTLTGGSYLKGLYYVDLGNGYLLLEGDAMWKDINSSVSDFGTMKDFLLNFNGLFDKWNSENVDVSNRKEFTKFVFIFFFLCIFYAFFNKFTGYDSANPGMVIYFIMALVLLGSMSAGFSCANHGCQGLFYYGNLFGMDEYESVGQAAGFMNNYILAIVMSFAVGGHLLSVMRRNS